MDLKVVTAHCRQLLQGGSNGRGIEGGAPHLEHLCLAPDHRSEAWRRPAAGAGGDVEGGKVAGTETQQRHAGNLQRRRHHFADHTWRHSLPLCVENLDDHQFGEEVPATPLAAIGKGGSHLGAGVGTQNFCPAPGLAQPLAEGGEGEVVAPQRLTDADQGGDAI